MTRSSLTLILFATWLVSGCGARTSEDDLLGFYDPPTTPRSGGSSAGGGDGDAASGGRVGAGGTGGMMPGVGGGNNPPGSCCVSRPSAGCSNSFVESCVCAFDSFCCESNWDQSCVDSGDALCDAGCTSTGGTGGMPSVGGSGGQPNTGGNGTGGVGGPPGGDCCETHGGVGCQVPAVEQCVCGLDPFCCQNNWDQICVSEAVFDCGANCSVGTGGVMNTGGVPNTGGVMNTGGGGGTGGVIEQCQVLFPDSCGSCLCSDCFDQFTSCLGDIGCLSIMNCLSTSGCEGFGCYQPSTCQGVIDLFGGLAGPSSVRAFSLMTCAVTEGCPCN